MVRSILITIVLFANSFNIMCQKIDNKYLLSIIYLKTNLEINKEIKDFFKKDIPKKIEYVPFNVSDEITFIDIEAFKDDILGLDDEFDTSIIEPKATFKKKYGFETYKLKFLENILPTCNNDLTLYFSKPIGNLLIAELANYDMNAIKGIKFGKGFRILFQFNERGVIENIYVKTFIYN